MDALVVAVDRQDVARLDEVEHELELLLVAVPGGVDRRVARRHDAAPDVVEPVDRLVDGALVARDRRRGEDDRVALVQLDLRVVAVGHAAQRAQRLALGSGRDRRRASRRASRRARAAGPCSPSGTSMCPSIRPMFTFLRMERPTSATLRSSCAAASTTCCTRWMFEAKHVTTIRPRAWGKTRSRFGPDAGLARREAGAVGVRRVAGQQQDALAAELGQALDVRGRPLDRRLVELVVARDEHGAELGRRRHGARVGDRVRHVQQLDVERAELEPLAGVDVGDVGLPEAVLVELGARHGRRQRTAEHRQVLAQLAQDPGQRPQVVLVAVGHDDALDVVDPRAQVAEVGQHQVDADHLGGREAQPDVDDEDPALVLEDHHVLADLAQPAEREDAECAGH